MQRQQQPHFQQPQQVLQPKSQQHGNFPVQHQRYHQARIIINNFPKHNLNLTTRGPGNLISISSLRVGHGAGSPVLPRASKAASTVISGELCVVDSHSSMYFCRPASLLVCLGTILLMCCTLTFSSYRIVEILTLGTITKICDAVYNTTNCFGRGSFDDSGVFRGFSEAYWDQCWQVRHSLAYPDRPLRSCICYGVFYI